MDDLERWLRSAMRGADQDPPVSLLTGVWLRRRRHLRRVRAGAVAAVAVLAIAVPSALTATLTPAARVAPPSGGGRLPPARAPGTELLKCPTYSDRGITGGQLSPHWQAASIQAGPVWFVYARTGGWATSKEPAGTGKKASGARLRNVAGPVLAVRNGVTVEVTTPLADQAQFRFLTSRSPSGWYTVADGVPGLTLTGCPAYHVPAGMPAAYAPGLTLFYLPLGYVTSLTGCVRMQVATPPDWRVRWTAEVPLNGGSCNS